MMATPSPPPWTPRHRQQATLAQSCQSPFHSPSPNPHPLPMSTAGSGWFPSSSPGPQPQTRQATPTPLAPSSSYDSSIFGVDPRLIQRVDGEGAPIYSGDYFALSHDQADDSQHHGDNSITLHPRQEQQQQPQQQQWQQQHQQRLYPDLLSLEQFQFPDARFTNLNGDTIPSSDSFYPDYSLTHPGFGALEDSHALGLQYSLGSFAGGSNPHTASPTPFGSPALTTASLSGHNSEGAPFSREGSSVAPFGGTPSDNDFEAAGGSDNYNVPYNQQLFDCLMAAPQHQLALREIYEWFVVCRGKNPDDKSWQNSIRHNLSMNDAFLKVTTPQHSHPNSPTASPANTHATPKNLWRLSPDAASRGFVEPTTRFRHHPHKKTTHSYQHTTAGIRKPAGSSRPNYPRPRYPTRGRFMKSGVDANGAGYYPNGVVSLSANDGCNDEDAAFGGYGDAATSPAPQRQASGSKGGCAARRSNRLKARMRMGLLNDSGYGYGFGGSMEHAARGAPTSHPGSRHASPLPRTGTPTPRSTPFAAALTRAGTPVQSRCSTPAPAAAQTVTGFDSRATSLSMFSTPEPDDFSLDTAGFGSEPQPHAEWQEGGHHQSRHQHPYDVHAHAHSFDFPPLHSYGFVDPQEQQQQVHHEQTPPPAHEDPNDPCNTDEALNPLQDLCDFVYGGTDDDSTSAHASHSDMTDPANRSTTQLGHFDPLLCLDDASTDLDLSRVDPACETLLKWSQPDEHIETNGTPTPASNTDRTLPNEESSIPGTPSPYSTLARGTPHPHLHPHPAHAHTSTPLAPPNTPAVLPACTATANTGTSAGHGLSVPTLPADHEVHLMDLGVDADVEAWLGGGVLGVAEVDVAVKGEDSG